MPDMTFSNPQGQQITVNSPDGSTPSENELDQLFSKAHNQSNDSDDNSIQEEKPEKISDIESSQQPQQKSINPNSTGNIATDIAGDVARGFINSGVGTIDKINGVVKLLKTATTLDLGSEGLTNVSDKLKQIASQQPQSNNPIVSDIGQFVGGVPDVLAEFAGTGGGVGFIARSAALSAADAYNKNQTPTSLIKGAATGAVTGAVVDKIPGALEGAAQLAKKWGQTSGKTYLQAVTGATDKEAQDIIDSLPTMDINPKNKIEDYNEAKETANAEISSLKDNNKNIIDQQKNQNTKEYESAKSISDDAVNNLIENNRDIIDDLRVSHAQSKEDLSSSTSTDMLQANDTATQKLTDAVTQNTVNVVKAKNALDNTLVSTFDTASKKLEAMTKGATEDVSNAHASLEKNDLDFIPTPIIKSELNNAIGASSSKYFKNLIQKYNTIDTLGAEKLLDKQVSPGIRVRDLPPEAQEQYRQQAIRQGQTNLGQLAKSSNSSDSLVAESGTGTGAVVKAINLINNTREGLVDEFAKTGKTSLSAIESQSMALENAIDKGFSGQSIPKGLVVTMAKIKQAINPTKLYEKYPKELSHLEPLANANKSYSTQIDGLRNALNLYKDNVDGTVNTEKVFKAIDRNDSSYIAKLKQADESLPPSDRIFDKVKNAYDNYKKVESSEKIGLSNTQKLISEQRLGLSKKFDIMKKKLNVEQRQELLSKIKETRESKRLFSQQQAKSLKDLHDRQRQTLDVIQSQKDKELSALQESVNKRLNSLHLLHMTRGTRASATGNARIFQNVANYRSIDGMTTLNPLKMIQGSIISKFASPSGAANTVKSMLKAPESMQGVKKLTNNAIFKRLLTTKISGR